MASELSGLLPTILWNVLKSFYFKDKNGKFNKILFKNFLAKYGFDEKKYVSYIKNILENKSNIIEKQRLHCNS